MTLTAPYTSGQQHSTRDRASWLPPYVTFTLAAPAAIGSWSVGLVLYLMLVALILLRWLSVPVTPAALGPPYWILMGATAISVLAGAQILNLPAALPSVRVTAGLVGGLSFVLWAFGT